MTGSQMDIEQIEDSSVPLEPSPQSILESLEALSPMSTEMPSSRLKSSTSGRARCSNLRPCFAASSNNIANRTSRRISSRWDRRSASS